MDIKTLEAFSMSDAVKFHDELNPNLWHNNELRPDVKKQLLLIAQDFMQELGLDDLKVEDITLSGSNAAYTYTDHSDLDLHILVDFNKLPNNEVYQELFNAKKTLYNDNHDITVHSVPIELYVQDTNQTHHSLGEYSLKNNKWTRIPKKRKADLDQSATKLKYDKLFDLIHLALKSKNIEKINELLGTIKRYRQAGLDQGGEFSPENLAFKALRSQGLINKLYALKNKLHSDELTIEDYDPNGPPPGPEFPPTMPQGTVRVDVSDVYDWYKLGQHISNLKGLGKHDFGKGPPSTIMAFGSEPEEHKYIKDLEKTGLTTTDIDPVDPHQPKGMKRQKVDPTYNVKENASGYIPSKKQADDPRFKTALTVDVKPDTIKKNAKAFGFKVSRAGIPPLLREGVAEAKLSNLVQYHGTRRDIDRFKPFTHFGTFRAARDRLEHTSKGSDSDFKNQKIYQVKLDIKNPINLDVDIYDNHKLSDYVELMQRIKLIDDSEAQSISTGRDLLKLLTSKGYDGIRYKNRWEDPGSISYVIFSPNQATITDIITYDQPNKMRRLLTKN